MTTDMHQSKYKVIDLPDGFSIRVGKNKPTLDNPFGHMNSCPFVGFLYKGDCRRAQMYSQDEESIVSAFRKQAIND